MKLAMIGSEAYLVWQEGALNFSLISFLGSSAITKVEIKDQTVSRGGCPMNVYEGKLS